MKICLNEIGDLTAPDFQAFPVWEFVLDQEQTSDTLVRPVENMPVVSMSGRILGAQARLANGNSFYAIFGNIDLANSRRTKHFLTITILHNSQSFFLARYHDSDYLNHGPSALASFLGLTIDDVFPIAYDIRPYCVGSPDVVVGKIEREPLEKLTKAEIIQLAIA